MNINSIERIKNFYVDGKTVAEICSLEGLSSQTIRKYLKELNIYNSNRDKSSDKKSIEIVKELYLNGERISDICIKVNRCEWTVRKWLTNLKIYNPRQYKYAEYKNLDFFHEIDNEEKAYWLGFIYADGCILDNRLDINLKQKDTKHLQKLSDIFNSPLYFYNVPSSQTGKIFDSVRLIVRSAQIYNDLLKNGIEQNKTYKTSTTILNHIQDNLIRHFIRGYFDGDGYVGYQKYDKIRQCRFNLIGIESFLQDIKCIMFKQIPNMSPISIVHNSDIISSLNVSKHNTMKLIHNWLYKESIIWLERKKEKFDEVLVEFC